MAEANATLAEPDAATRDAAQDSPVPDKRRWGRLALMLSLPIALPSVEAAE